MNETHLTIERLICLKRTYKNLDYSKIVKKNNKGHIHTYKTYKYTQFTQPHLKKN